MKVRLLLLSHAALGLAGWGLATALRPATPPEPAKAATKTHRPRPTSPEAENLVRRIRSDLAKQTAEEAKKVPPEVILRGKLLARLSALAAPEDPAAAFRQSLAAARDEDSEITAGALFILWAQADPAAAVTFAQEKGLDSLASKHAHMACELAGERLPPTTLLPLLESAESGRDDFLKGMAKTQASRRPAKELAGLVSGCSKELQRSTAFHLKEQWPIDRLDDLGAFVTALDTPDLLLDYGSDPWSDEDFSAWLVRFVEQHPDAGFAARIKNSSSYATDVGWNSSLPLETRIKAMRESTRHVFHAGDPASARHAILVSLAEREIPDFLSPGDGPDLRHAFRHGQLEATDLLSKLSARFPHYAETGELPRQLHENLWAEDPDRAAVLLKHLPEAERVSALTKSYEANLYQASLDTLAEALRHLPAPTDDAAIAVRGEILSSFVDHGLDDYGPDYLDWIKTLPETTDRKAALEAIARRIEHSMAWKALEIRRIVGDTPLPSIDN